jgi:hypothetical protein
MEDSSSNTQIYPNRRECIEIVEGALKTIVVSMANCELYASFFVEALDRRFTSPGATTAWEKQLEMGLPEFYASVIVFSVKVKSYFTAFSIGKFHDCLIGIFIVYNGHYRTVHGLFEAVSCVLPTLLEPNREE